MTFIKPPKTIKKPDAHFSAYSELSNSLERRADEAWSSRVQIYKTLVPLPILASLYLTAKIDALWTYGLVMAIAFAVFVYHLRLSRADIGLHRKADLPSGGKQFTARVRVKYGGRQMCEDVGIVTFLDGYLMYEGMRVQFGLRSQDCEQTNFGSDNFFAMSTCIEDKVPLRIGFLVISDLSDPSHLPRDPSLIGSSSQNRKWSVSRKFRDEWLDWRETEEREISYSTFPPMEPYPDPQRISKIYHQAISLGVYGALILNLVIHQPFAFVVPEAFAIAALGLMIFGRLSRRTPRILIQPSEHHPIESAPASVRVDEDEESSRVQISQELR